MEAAALLRSPTATSLSLRCSTPSTTRSSTTPSPASPSPHPLSAVRSPPPHAPSPWPPDPQRPRPSDPLPKGADAFFRTVISNMEKVYLSRNPTAKAVLDLVQSHDGNNVCYDHFAFRTFGVDGYGINSLAGFFMDFGYTPREELRFPAKKLKALWFSPPASYYIQSGTGVDGPLPRIFISELLVEEMSSQCQEVIRKYIKTSGSGHKHAVLASTSGCLTWEKPIYSDYQILSRESEYAAWTLVNGYALNHVTISTHRLKSHIRSIKSLNQFIEDSGFKLNSEGES
uniref:2-oxoadipate dioxygenase/decarboxylase n=1 Tax=Ananas comosus var. bracteatus TaxID=296719 RepID=A0A6V7QJ00_ANACO|nr:unnamed protein product [Ananas comosus var. bracteatus]